jgi:hypothetical protein
MRIGSAAAVILALSAAGASAQPTDDDAGNLAVPLPAMNRVSAEQAETRSTLHCNAARDFCLRAWREADGSAWFLDIHHRVPAGANAAPARRMALPAGEDPERETHQIWPHLIREASGALLLGVERRRTAGFSGGGAGATHLLLFRMASRTAEPVEMLTVQTNYTAMIRACFSEDEYRNRGACHDEYEFSGTFNLAPNAGSGRPRLAFATTARSFPRGVRAAEGEQRRFRRADLVWERDPACSYRRNFAFDAASGNYAPDRPLPDCSTYSLP